jgi:trimethyllysine dioxygenase
MPICIKNIKINQDGLRLELSNGIVSEIFPWIWLRDHATESHSFSMETKQRIVDIFKDQTKIAPENVVIKENETLVEIDWGKNLISHYSVEDFLEQNSNRQLLELPQNLWSKVTFKPSDVQIPYAEKPTNSQLLELFKKIQFYGFCLVENCPADSESTDQFLQNLGVYYNSHWGGFWEFENNQAQEDSAYSADYISSHNDCCYYDHSPCLQTFHCLYHQGEGGYNFLVDGFAIAKDLKESDPESYQILTSINVPYHCTNTDVAYWSEKPIIRLGNQGEVKQISYNNYDRGKVWYGYKTTEKFYHAYGKLHQMANDSQRQFCFKLNPRSLLIFNNWRLLHGRTAFTGIRKMCGSYHGFDSVVARYQSLISSQDG